MSMNKLPKFRALTDEQLQRRADILRRKQERKRAEIERKMQRASKHAFDFAIKL